ncbi:hypothetical protein EYW49_22055 [Siculibacillus lacustris]|uniref:Uncharacterized protein n=1 Tax=Siculibacillus lacustris TaxID=1549641 RepID=A0A4Q9VEV4_9HYPH|nr:hypothetical protein [Siculibacillus lacustris]TBW32423.1 hypothetical protein EYW49_22055 [Siculibacillus lacustris]
MRNVMSLVLGSAVLAVIATGAARAQTAGATVLTDAEKAAVSAILDNVGRQDGEALRQSLVGTISGLGATGANPRNVVAAAKLGAGSRLQTLNSALLDLCLSRTGGGVYCQLAAVPVPNTADASIQTAATGDGAAAGGFSGGTGIGGAASTATGGNRGGGTTSGSITPSSSSVPIFTAPTFTPTTTVVPLVSSTRTVIVTGPVTVPGPIAGAGLPALVGLGLLWYRSRRRAGASCRDGVADAK